MVKITSSDAKTGKASAKPKQMVKVKVTQTVIVPVDAFDRYDYNEEIGDEEKVPATNAKEAVENLKNLSERDMIGDAYSYLWEWDILNDKSLEWEIDITDVRVV